MSNQPTKADRPSTLKRAPRPAADERVDPVDYQPATPTPAPRPTVTATSTAPAVTAPPQKKARRAPTVPFSTRIAADVSELIDTAATEQDMTIRAVVEYAIRQTYGASQ